MANKPMWLVNAESLEKMYSNSQTNFRAALQEYRPLWDDPEKQRQAMRFNALLKRKLWDRGARKYQAHLNLERLLATPPQRHGANIAALMKLLRGNS